MKKAILPLVILTSLLASCGQEATLNESQQQLNSEQIAPQALVLNVGETDEQLDYPNIKLNRKHIFSNGEVFEYTTYNDKVIDGDMIIGNLNDFKKYISEYESKITGIKQQGAIASKCTAQFLGFLWCNQYQSQKWNNNIIYFEPYSASLSGEEKNIINSALAHIESKTRLRFVTATSGDRIYFTNTYDDGCHSELGRIGGRQQLNLGNGCKTMGIAVHELLHAAGMIHEMQRPDRDTYITVNSTNLTDKGKRNINAIHQASDIFFQSTFDYGSIMMYPQYTTDTSFVYDTRLPMFYPKQSYGGIIGQRDGMSSLDVQTINSRYQ